MDSFGDEVAALYRSGMPEAKLRKLCRDWKLSPTDYGLARAVRQAIDEDVAEEVYETLADDAFHTLKTQQLGIEELRQDFRAGVEYFSTRRPDLARYIHTVMLERAVAGDTEFLAAQQRICQGFEEFLQLDALPAEHRAMGLSETLARFFPIDSTEIVSTVSSRASAKIAAKLSPDYPATIVRLAGYDLGTWRCSCGSKTGFMTRYDFACPCGALHGNGRLGDDAPTCARCEHQPAYSTCPECDTRVTLENLWTLRRGGASPSTYQVPLVLHLVVERKDSSVERVRLTLMQLPVPLGIRERKGSVVFGVPAVFWFGEFEKRSPLDPQFGMSFISLDGLRKYDRQTDMCKILEAAFRRTLWESNLTQGSYRHFGVRLLNWLESGRAAGLDRDHTRGFRERIGFDASEFRRRDLNLVQFSGDEVQCWVAASDQVVKDVVLVSSNVARTSMLTVSYLLNLRASLPDDAVLTAHPPGVSAHQIAALDACGLSTPGGLVEPGQVLAGIAAPVVGDTSLYMPGMRPGRIIGQQLVLSEPGGFEVPAAPGRLFMRNTSTGTDHVNMVVAVERQIETGDVLVATTGGSALVSGIASRQMLARIAETGAEPDLVVAPDHPWAPPAGGAGLRKISVTLRNPDPSSASVTAYATSGYGKLPLTPPNLPEIVDSAQVLEPKHFRWLIDRGARHLATELYGPRGDAPIWRVGLQVMEVLEGPDRRLPGGTPFSTWSALSESPSDGIRLIDQYLRGVRLVPAIRDGMLACTLMTDAEVLAASCGEVTTYLDHIAERRGTGGLYSEQIFGSAGQSDPWRLMGHIELPFPVVHGWFLHGAAGKKLADFVGLTVEQLRRIVDCWDVVVTDRGTSHLRRGEFLQRDKEWEKYNRGTDGVRLAAGGEAVEFLIRQANQVHESRVPADGVVIRRLPVLSPALHPGLLQSANSFYRSDLGKRYRNVLRCVAALRRASEGFRSFTQLADYAALQESTEQLMDHARTPVGFHDGIRLHHISAGSIANVLLSAREPAGTLRERLLNRTVDYSASARLVIGDTPDIATALLPSAIAWSLFELEIFGALVRSGAAATFPDARDNVERRTAQAEHALRDVCARSLILLAPPEGAWPLVALRVWLADGHAVQVHPELLDRIGRGNLGQHVRIFSVLTTEAMADARSLLTPEQLDTPRTADSTAGPAVESVFDVPQRDLVDWMALAAWRGEPVPLAADDHLLLCDSDWRG